jgi:hypothetical protein
MARFIVRVELHGATGTDYDKLHEAMEKVGFSRVVQGGNGVRVHLPTAEYFVEGNFTLVKVHSAAQIAADSTGKANSILANKCINAMWSGLQPVQ